ncbi:hypothetical protein GQ600_10623 [Phytophthora cactorum]|nr:hypothetical protein GQ600_10623 [Phytophthora cactorum]
MKPKPESMRQSLIRLEMRMTTCFASSLEC